MEGKPGIYKSNDSSSEVSMTHLEKYHILFFIYWGFSKKSYEFKMLNNTLRKSNKNHAKKNSKCYV